MNYRTVIKAVIPLIIAFISIFVLSKYAASPEFHKNTIEALDEKRTTVMELTAASTAASAAITLLPGDAATPIAEKLADLSSCFLLVICAVYLEKYLVTITGYAAFVLLIPIACILLSVNVFLKNNIFRSLAIRLAAFGLAIVLVIPASVKVSDLIEKTYQHSIEMTIQSAKESAEILEEGSEEDTEEKEGFLGGILSKVKDGVSDAAAKAENVLSNFMEALAVMIVTSCVIPVLVLLFFVWLVKMILGIHLPKQETEDKFS
ncbi:MAG: hypothetical protein ACI4DV_00425 [Lachnospiraceae bacterium]